MSSSNVKRLQEWDRQTNKQIENLYEEFKIYENINPPGSSETVLLVEKIHKEYVNDSKEVNISKMREQLRETQAALEMGSFLEKLLK